MTMAMSPTTDWSKIRYSMLLIFAISVLLSSTVATGLNTSGKQKRQLFREHLLPERGGKIPETAFILERISLNQLNKEGFYNADGNILERKFPLGHHHEKKPFINTIKITVPPDGRYVAPAGRLHAPRVVDTTYLIREPVTLSLKPYFLNNKYPVIPSDSLRIYRYFKYGKSQEGNGCNLSPNDLPSKIFMEFAPYLRKLHESD